MSSRGTVLVVDDDLDAAETISESLRARGFRATPEADPLEALEGALDERLDVLVTDVDMPGLDGLQLCARISAARPELPVVVLTGRVSIGAATGALRAGAFDFLAKPVDPEVFALTVARAVDHHRFAAELRRPGVARAELRGVGRLLGESLAMSRLRAVVRLVAPTQATVLITGESGTGKELVARAIHESSARARGPFVAVNCAAIPAPLLESELFGHAQGAFTDARIHRRGLLLEAEGGTLFLDEIGEMPVQMQAKLLRALQERTVRAVGGTIESPCDARVLTATHRDLERDVFTKRFRQDLYYRINVCSVEVPPLRGREGDVAALARAFVQRFAVKHGKAVKGIAFAALSKLVQYGWPGNVRELENGIERAVAMARFDHLGVEDLPARVSSPLPARLHTMATTVAELVTFDELESRYMKHVLALVGGNKTHAARILGFDRRTIYRKLHPVAPSEPAVAALRTTFTPKLPRHAERGGSTPPPGPPEPASAE